MPAPFGERSPRISSQAPPGSLQPEGGMLDALDLSFGYGTGAPLLERASLSIAPGEVVGLAGASGSGKSTLARILAGFLAPSTGNILVNGTPLPTSGFSPVQMLFQT